MIALTNQPPVSHGELLDRNKCEVCVKPKDMES